MATRVASNLPDDVPPADAGPAAVASRPPEAAWLFEPACESMPATACSEESPTRLTGLAMSGGKKKSIASLLGFPGGMTGRLVSSECDRGSRRRPDHEGELGRHRAARVGCSPGS